MDKYAISLGIDFDGSGELQKVKNQINSLTDNTHRVRIDIDNSRLLKQIKHAKSELKALNNISGNNKTAISIDTVSLEKSLNEVSSTIKEIKNSMGTIDSGSGMKSLLSSINQISGALEKASGQFESLNASLNALSGKDFNINFGINLGKSNSVSNNADYGNYVRQELYPELKRQEEAITEYLAKHYKTNPLNALDKLYKGAGRAGGLQNIITMLDNLETPIKKGDDLSFRISQFQDFFRDVNEMAKIQGIDLSPVLSQFDKTSEEIVKTAYDIKNGTSQVEQSFEKLERVFGGGNNLNIDGISAQLDSIVVDLGEIRTAIQSLSSVASLDGLTASFDRLSETLEKLLVNLTSVQSTLNNGFANIGSSVGTGTSAVNNIEKASDSSAAAVIQNEKKKQEAYKATADAVVYHAGILSKLNKAETSGRFYGSNRGTGYFGTGHYFVDSATKHELDSSYNYSKLPYSSVDISQYDNLFRVTSDEVGYALHDFLKNLTRFTQGSDNFDVSELFAQFKNVFGDAVMDVQEFGARIDSLKTFMSKSDFYDRSDSVSTQFMKSLGYGGVDTRGTSLADTRYGTVIYDLKEESVLQANITDEIQKRGQMLEKINYEQGQVFDKDTDDKILKQLDEQAKRREIADEFEKSFDTTNFNKADNDLENAKNRIKEIDEIISNCQYSIENADIETKKFARDMADLGLDVSDEEIDEYKRNSVENYQRRIDELSQEKSDIQSKIPALEETYNKELQLMRDANEQAKQVVEQRRLEAQQAQSSANAVVQNEERKQQAYRETAETVESTSQQAQKIISDAAQKSIDDVSSEGINKYFKIDKDDSKSFEREMSNLVSQWTDGKGRLKDVKIDTRTTWDKDTERNIERLHQAHVTYNNGLDETINKTIAWRKIGAEFDAEGKENPIYGFAEVSSKYSKSIIDTTTKTNSFIKQQKQAASNLANQINQLNRAAIDQNASRPIKEDVHLDALSSKYNEIISAIQRLKSASSDTFVDEQNNVKALISEYKSLVSEYKNAENVSTKMRGSDFQSGLDIARNDLEKFKAEARDFPQINDTIEKLSQNLSMVGDASSLNEFNDQLRVARSELAKIKTEVSASNRNEKVGINVSGLESQINELRKISPEIDTFEAEINGAKVTVQSLLNDLNKVNTQGDFSVINSKFKAFASAAKEAGISVESLVQTQERVKDIKLKLGDDGEFATQIQKIKSDIDKFSEVPDSLREKINELENAWNSMSLANEKGDIQGMINAWKDYKTILDSVKNQLKQAEIAQKDFNKAQKEEADAQKLQYRIKNFQAEINAWLRKNSAAAKEFGEELSRLKAAAKSADETQLDNLIRQFKILDKEAEAAGLKTLSVGDKIKTKFKEYSTYFGVAEVFMWVEQGLRDMFQQVVAIDSAMTELKKVTDESDASYNQFLVNAASRASEIGTTIDGLVSSTADFARLGYSFESSQGLAEVANIYAVVGDEIDSVETATQSLISTFAAFKNEADGLSDADFAMNIIDKFNEVSNNFAISSGGIGEALQRSASSLYAANNTLDESIALITAANTVVQDPDVVGTALKTVSMRVRGAKTE